MFISNVAICLRYETMFNKPFYIWEKLKVVSDKHYTDNVQKVSFERMMGIIKYASQLDYTIDWCLRIYKL